MPPKRRSHGIADLRRHKPRREPYDRVLIVCEGEKTEPNYFRELCTHYRLSSANIEVTQGEGNDPGSIVGTAKRRQKLENKQGERYDRIYCVFDRDEHVNYVDACHQAEVVGFLCMPSIPSFEYWFLLHFEDSRAPFQRGGNHTAAQNCERTLRRHLETYEKGMKGLFEQLLPRLSEAAVRAARVLEDARRTGDDNPSTRVHELVNYLQHLKD